jgi:hypothetical protein
LWSVKIGFNRAQPDDIAPLGTKLAS